MLRQKPTFCIGLGDCIKGIKGLDQESVDLVITSPPYNLGKEYGVYDDNRTPTDYMEWCKEWASEVLRVLKRAGSFFLNVGGSPSNPLLPFEMAMSMRKLFHLQNTIHWIKSISIDQDNGAESFGHFKPINSKRFLNDCHEYVFHFTATGDIPLNRLAIGVPYADKSNIKRWSHTRGKDKRCRGNAWFIPYQTIRSRDKERPHPATFPVKLAVNCIRLAGGSDCVVLDPFLGIGHTAVAANQCADQVGRFIGFDVDEDYVKVACDAVGCDYTTVAPEKSPCATDLVPA